MSAERNVGGCSASVFALLVGVTGCSYDGTKTWPGPYIAAAAERQSTCAVAKSGEIECWGEATLATTAKPSGPFQQVAIGEPCGVGLRQDGTLASWGGTNCAPAPSGEYLALAAGHDACALERDRDLVCWVLNDKRRSPRTTPGPFERLGVGESIGCAIREDDSLHCWGDCSSGPDGPPRECPARVPPPAGAFVEVATNGHFACALALDGAIQCWGDTSAAPAPPPSGAGFKKISTRGDTACAVDAHDQIVCWGAPIEWFRRVYEPPPGPFVDVTVGGVHVCGLRPDGELPCWGADQQGQVSDSPPWGRN